MRYNIVLKPLALAGKIDRAEVAWNLGEELPGARSAGVLKPIVLQNGKPD